ncbi:MAG: acyl-CoA dehydrogenase family protein, partial [Acidimicrobiales bacterium]
MVSSVPDKSRVPGQQSPFVFSGEHQQFEEAVASLAAKELREGYLERATSDEMCWGELRRLGRHGLLGMGLPESLGGQGADATSRGIACEQVAKADFNLAYLVFASEMAAAVVRGLAPAVADPLARAVAAGERLVALALTEPRGGSDASGTAVRARPVPGGHV